MIEFLFAFLFTLYLKDKADHHHPKSNVQHINLFRINTGMAWHGIQWHWQVHCEKKNDTGETR